MMNFDISKLYTFWEDLCFVVTCLERADLLALACGVYLWVCHFPVDILGQVWYLIVLIPDLCTLTNFTLCMTYHVLTFVLKTHNNAILWNVYNSEGISVSKMYLVYLR